MINDILEQLAEDYFRHLGYFTQHNVKYRPNKKGPSYAVNSDVDIVGVHPKKIGLDKVIVASCKSWHGGLQIAKHLKHLEGGKYQNKVERTFREVSKPVWSNALKNQIRQLTGRKNFIMYFVCTKYDKKDQELWENNKVFSNNLKGCKVKILSMKDMAAVIWKTSDSITPAHSELSGLLQMIYHSGGRLEYPIS